MKKVETDNLVRVKLCHALINLEYFPDQSGPRGLHFFYFLHSLFYLMLPCYLHETKLTQNGVLTSKCDVFFKFTSNLVTMCWEIYADDKLFYMKS